jgi:hypothetical protein
MQQEIEGKLPREVRNDTRETGGGGAASQPASQPASQQR